MNLASFIISRQVRRRHSAVLIRGWESKCAETWEGEEGREVGKGHVTHEVCHLANFENSHPRLANEAKVTKNQNLIRT